MTLLEEFKENEEHNAHAENYVLLATYFGNNELRNLANRNI
jgi:hypothetical protein